MDATSTYVAEAGPVIRTVPANPQRPRSSFLRSYLSSHKGGITTVVLTGLLSSLSSFLLTLIIGDFFMLQFQTGSSKGKLLAWLGIRLHTVQDFFWIFGGLLLFKFISSFYEGYLSARQGERFVKELRHILFTAQIMSPAEQFAGKPFGNYLLRYSNDLKAVQNCLTRGVLGGIKHFLFVLTGLFLLLRINLLLGLISAGLFLLIVTVVAVLSAGQKKYIRESRTRRSNLLAFVTRSFSRFRHIKQENSEDQVLDKYERRAGLLYKANLANGKAESFIQSVAYLLQFGMIGCLLWVMTWKAAVYSAADGLIVVLLLLLMQGAVRNLLKVPSYLNKGRISLDKIRELTHQQSLPIA
ncbi:MAG: ABC transporter ATP-binding protein [Sphingobacteriales bacterium]|nr:ABC transporter ATP-binding protein [Sphingobacteriales bacterium]